MLLTGDATTITGIGTSILTHGHCIGIHIMILSTTHHGLMVLAMDGILIHTVTMADGILHGTMNHIIMQVVALEV